MHNKGFNVNDYSDDDFVYVEESSDENYTEEELEAFEAASESSIIINNNNLDDFFGFDDFEAINTVNSSNDNTEPEERGDINSIDMDESLCENIIKPDNSDNLKLSNTKVESDEYAFKIKKAISGLFNSEEESTKPDRRKLEYNDDDEEKAYKSKYHPSEIAKLFMEEEIIVCIDGKPHIYIEKLGYWKVLSNKNSMKDLREIVPDCLRVYVDKNKLREVYDWLVTDGKNISSRDLINRKQYINLKDCAVDIETKEKVKNRKELYFQYHLAVTYDECFKSHMDGSTYKTFVDSLFGKDKQTRKAFEEMIGLVISNIRDSKYSFFLYGRSNTGKSVVLNVLKGLIGEEYVSSVSFSQLADEFAVASLEGKFLNISGEISGVANRRIDIFKSLTGNDPITVSFKGMDHFQLVNQALLVFACNELPNISAKNIESFVSRMIIFPFNNVVPREEWIQDLAEMLLEEPGVIVKAALKGLKRLKKRRFVFDESNAMLMCKQNFVREYNSFMMFADKHIRANAESQVSSKRLKKAYIQFCNDNGLKILADNVWSQLLQSNFKVEKKNITSGNELNFISYNSRGYKGIELVGLKPAKFDFLPKGFSDNSDSIKPSVIDENYNEEGGDFYNNYDKEETNDNKNSYYYENEIKKDNWDEEAYEEDGRDDEEGDYDEDEDDWDEEAYEEDDWYEEGDYDEDEDNWYEEDFNYDYYDEDDEDHEF